MAVSAARSTLESERDDLVESRARLASRMDSAAASQRAEVDARIAGVKQELFELDEAERS